MNKVTYTNPLFDYRKLDNDDFNCGGFALNTLDWVTPYYFGNYENVPEGTYTEMARTQLIYDLINDGNSYDHILEVILECDTAYLLQTYPFLEEVRLEEISDTDRLVAYRIGLPDIDDPYFDADNGDFHFRVRINGFWFEKMGEYPISLCYGDINQPWICPDAEEPLFYDSEIKYFRVKNY